MSDNQQVKKKSDWKTSDMPAQHTAFSIYRHFTDEEMQNLKRGNIPQEMEDKWFWYFEGNTLYAHRSWTGYCVYVLIFHPCSLMIDAIVNRDPEQYTCQDVEEDKKIVNDLLDWWVKPTYDYYNEWLSETMNNINKKQFAVTTDHILIDGKTHDAVFFHKPDEPNGFMSNWWLADFVLDGMKFSSVEQYIMYRKCVSFGDMASAQAVMATDDTAEQQDIGRNATGYNGVVWSGLRQVILMRGIAAKFAQNEAMRDALINTGDAYLVECAKSDRVWACGLSLWDSRRKIIGEWPGANILGFALMETRTMLMGHMGDATRAAEQE